MPHVELQVQLSQVRSQLLQLNKFILAVKSRIFIEKRALGRRPDRREVILAAIARAEDQLENGLASKSRLQNQMNILLAEISKLGDQPHEVIASSPVNNEKTFISTEPVIQENLVQTTENANHAVLEEPLFDHTLDIQTEPEKPQQKDLSGLVVPLFVLLGA